MKRGGKLFKTRNKKRTLNNLKKGKLNGERVA